MIKKLVILNILIICLFFWLVSAQTTKEKNKLKLKINSEQIENSASGQAGQGFLSSIQGDNKSAIKHFSKTIELEPDNAIAYHQRGIAYYNLGDYQNALIDFNKTIELDSDNMDAYGNRSLVEIELKDYKSALDDIEKILKIAPDSTKAIKQKRMILKLMEQNIK